MTGTNAEGATGTNENVDEHAEAGADDGAIIVAIGAEPSLGLPEDDDAPIDGQPAPQFVKDLRKKAREDSARIRELEASEAALKRAQQSTQAPAAVVVGVKPTLESCEYDADKFERDLIAWTERKAQAEQQTRDETARTTNQQQQYQTRLNAYAAGALALKVDDFPKSEKAVEAALSSVQQSIIVKLAKNSALFIYALGRDPAKLAELSKVSDPVAFAYEMAALEKEIKTMPKSKFTAEQRPNAGGGGGSLAGGNKALEAARKKAETTGDYTEVNKINREIKDAERKRQTAG